MNSTEILKIVRINKGLNGKFGEYVADQLKIVHKNRPNTHYVILGVMKIDINNKWYTFIQYKDVKSEAIYARLKDNFHNFKQVKE